MRSAGSWDKSLKIPGAGARPATDGQNNEPRLDFLQEGFQADVEADPALTRKGGQFQQSDIGHCQAVRILARLVDGGPCPPGDLILVKPQPDHNMRINQNQESKDDNPASPFRAGIQAGQA